MTRNITRRALLGTFGVLGTAAVGTAAVGAAVDARLLPGRSTMFRLLGLDGRPGTIPAGAPVPTRSGAFRSTARAGRTVGWTIAAPQGHEHLPVVVALHGYAGSHASLFGRHLGLDRFLAAHVRAGGRPFAIAAVDGGNGYWHHRESGDDPGTMVLDEFVPMLARQGFDTRRIGLTGYSMGGYGALHLAAVLGRAAASVATAMSPALWSDAGRTPPGAFDDAADFRRNEVWSRRGRLRGVALRVDCGTGDGFEPAARAFVQGFPADDRPTGAFEAGGHDLAYWRRIAPAHIAFLGAHLAT